MTTRALVEDEILASALLDLSPVQIVEASRGAGKTTLLRSLRARLRATGSRVALIEMDRLCAGPGSVARHLPRVVAREIFDDTHPANPDATHGADVVAAIEQELQRRKPDPVLLLDLAVGYPGRVAEEIGLPLILLLDELGEAGSLSRHAGLKRWPAILAERLVGDPRLSIIATTGPASRPAALIEEIASRAALAGRGMARVTLPPLGADEIAASLRSHGCPAEGGSGAIGRWLAATNGHPAYVEILARRVARGVDLPTALITELTPPHGLLHLECRFDYHHLVERSRGHAAVRSILQLLVMEEGANLSRVARHLGTSLPTAIDYLSWLLEVGLIARAGRGYLFADPLLKIWIATNGPEAAELNQAVHHLLAQPVGDAVPSTLRRSRPAAAPQPVPLEPRHAPSVESLQVDASDRLMEID